MNSYIVSFDKSDKDIPCLTVFRKNMFDPKLEMIDIIIGEKAETIWNELNKKVQDRSEENNGQ